MTDPRWDPTPAEAAAALAEVDTALDQATARVVRLIAWRAELAAAAGHHTGTTPPETHP